MSSRDSLYTAHCDRENPTPASSYAVLLYYQYVNVDDEVAAADWMRGICEEQGLLGRVRVSKQGFNVTVRIKSEMRTQSPTHVINAFTL